MLSKFNAIDSSNGPGFLLRILRWSQSGNHPENDLAKFGYILDMKVFFSKKQNPSMFLVIPSGTYLGHFFFYL
jgi:hypothetical protein